jgi:uncharacterized membrane protein (UPF0127 family)
MESGVVVEGRSGMTLEVTRCRNAGERMRGLLGTDALPPGHGLLLAPARQVHTFGMRYPIDVVFCTGDFVVVRVIRGLRPNRFSPLVLRARQALEFRSGEADAICEGDQLSWRDL